MGPCSDEDLILKLADPTGGFYLGAVGLGLAGMGPPAVLSLLQGLFADLAGDGYLDGDMLEGDSLIADSYNGNTAEGVIDEALDNMDKYDYWYDGFGGFQKEVFMRPVKNFRQRVGLTIVVAVGAAYIISLLVVGLLMSAATVSILMAQAIRLIVAIVVGLSVWFFLGRGGAEGGGDL